MKRTIGLLTSLLLVVSSSFASAQDMGGEKVTFTMKVSQPTLFDTSKLDTFDGTIDDRSGTTTLKVTCSAGATGTLGFGRVDETCALAGLGSIKNPKDLTKSLPRINYTGGFVIQAKADGYVQASDIKANYVRAGQLNAENSSFEGSLRMMPENPSASALQLRDRLIKNLTETATGTSAVQFDTKIDSVRFENFTIPHVGFGTSKSCSLTGDSIFAYANEAWQMQLDATCGDVKYKLEGNMPLVDVTGLDHQQEYRLNLVVPGAGGGDPFAEADPFATVDGVVGTFRLKNSGREVDGVFENVKIDGELTGTGVPLELVRGIGQTMAILGRTYFGA